MPLRRPTSWFARGKKNPGAVSHPGAARSSESCSLVRDSGNGCRVRMGEIRKFFASTGTACPCPRRERLRRCAVLKCPQQKRGGYDMRSFGTAEKCQIQTTRVKADRDKITQSVRLLATHRDAMAVTSVRIVVP